MDDMPKKPASFDPARFRMGGTTSAEPPVRKVLTAVPTGKPGKQQFVRTRVGDEWRAECGLLKLEGDERPYIVDREAAQYVALDIKHVQLRLGIDRQGNLFLWSVPLPDQSGPKRVAEPISLPFSNRMIAPNMTVII